MKNIFILTSFLLLSSNAIGDNHKGNTLYVLGEYPDWEWVESGDKDIHPKYQGQVKGGKPNYVDHVLDMFMNLVSLFKNLSDVLDE